VSDRIVLTLKTEDGTTIRIAGTVLSSDGAKLGKDFMEMCDRYREKVRKEHLP
jgi:hypothetical protein